ncbi:unnamed protein product [Gongylonema pulchrum]|uniref:Uncharacterized protein n=1 Tax=Gongylonema pulchrum TaxID=637853 RepID=A0A183CUV2_9BILA|nr:unnamed protein product [Gongylonema pulchrum]
MDRIRRSFRQSFRRRVPGQYFGGGGGGSPTGGEAPNGSTSSSNGSKAGLWQPDEAAVLNGTCSFSVRV